ncbi:PREDICTED: uncharacterized protein LOC107327945 isoform X1 [Acropora digitifera]|uniref:uncharacterized protein LOC107327945 isoform X1 n=1 Tax=Acropora digitifera TaxID=70779 RepID=UPI00077A2619|nr:PREDICTED: uncharacterized protein LOC107327945 isoform X1 [Acropora digitifera]XP_015748155.1 PREDICTED: uncharacterized protein LOC107327945 isoform X1 [Acropora digitifera]XP_015748156.1 PREDICTED: uncharacterized protein LOC107327945 isoform X1 [Acropora digitifera]XP_015748157.1 PREDICTED: uncharacterized protein LOC107327945 isoform X1 [Acropora digitifera]XP_015748158.1 PREDICTED: uncharacterized protein LOC107327945 isoform X1 [Acropora digitifera]
MKASAVIVFLVLAMLTSQAFSWGWSRRRRRTTRFSPAGGLSGNPNAVVCTFYRSRDQVTCKKGGSSVTCTTQPPTETRDDKDGGPTPRGEYLIGRRNTHWRKKIDWYNLFPKKEDNSGYYSYTQSTKTGRSHMGLHPGSFSLGCVTVKESTCWGNIRSVIDSGTMQYRNWPYSGFLYVK